MAAATRHFRDGSLLEENGRLANADQLFGFAAECGIKSVLVQLPGHAAEGSLSPGLRQHVNDLWDHAAVNSIHRRYRGLLVVLKRLPNPFSDWSPDQRYGPDDAVSEGALELHRRAAVRVLGSIGLSGARRED